MSGTRISGTIRVILAFTLLLASLTTVVWRQSRAHEALRELDRVRREHAVARGERAMLQRELQRLSSRGYVIDAAAERLRMRVPEGEEIILVPEPRP